MLAIVIPAYAEEAFIERTLASLNASVLEASVPASDVAVIVVFNRPLRQNDKTQGTEARPRALHRRDYAFHLTVLDHTRPGLRYGVGEARRIGMDHAAREALAQPSDLIVSLDADTTVGSNYISGLLSHRLTGSAFTLGFEHPLDHAKDRPAIVLYELYLRYIKLQFERIGSPFGYYTIGSALGTDVANYRAVGGMVMKTATEDFHFLNKLRKRGPIDYWPEIRVFPEPRESQRVHLGTGYFLAKAEMSRTEAFGTLMLPSPALFDRLGRLLRALPELFHDPHRKILDLEEPMRLKLVELRSNCSAPETFQKRWIEVFDSLAAWRLLRTWADQETKPSEDDFIDWCSSSVPGESAEGILLSWRALERRTAIATDARSGEIVSPS